MIKDPRSDGNERAHQDLIDQQWARVLDLAQEALRTGGVVFLADPEAEALNDGTEPLGPGVVSGVLPQHEAENVARTLGGARAGTYIEQLRATPTDRLRVMTIAGDGLGLVTYEIQEREAKAARWEPRVAEVRGEVAGSAPKVRAEYGSEGEIEYSLNAAGILKLFHRFSDAEFANMTRPGGPKKAQAIRRFQERVRGAMAAEEIKATPRSLDAVIWDVGRGAALQERMRRQGSAALEAWFEEIGGQAS